MTIQGVSDAELQLLIAGLNPQPIEERCTVSDLLVSQCAHCKQLPDVDHEPLTLDGPRLGPWFACQHPGSCSGCGARFAEFDFIRADSTGGWLAQCCSEMTPDATGGIVAERPAPPRQLTSTVRELRSVL